MPKSPCIARQTKLAELHDHRIVEPQPLAQCLAVGDAGLLTDDGGDRIADKSEQRERDQRHDQHHDEQTARCV
jgi:hypothetical protein